LHSTITYQKESNYVYVYSNYIDDEGVKNSGRKNSTVYRLSISSGDIDSVGVIEKHFENFLVEYPIKLNTKLGLLFLDAKSPIVLCDFEKNSILEFPDLEINRLYKSDKAQWLPFILVDSTIFFERDGLLDSILLNTQKIIDTKN